MKALTILAGLTLATTAATALSHETPDERAIRQNIERYYFEGVRNSDTAAAHRAFHPVAQMHFIKDGHLSSRTIPDWLAGIAQRAPNPPRPDSFPRRVVSVDVSGTAATAKLRLDYEDAVITDYMSLLKVDGQWVIVGKIFDRRPRATSTSSR